MPVAVVTEEKRLVMQWNGVNIVDISREFLNSNGASKHIDITPEKYSDYKKEIPSSFSDGFKALAQDLNVCSKRGLSERFDSTIGAGTVLMPFGGKYQKTPIQAMVQKVSVEKKHTDTCSLMSWGYNPDISVKSPYHGAYLAVIESVCKLIATGAAFEDVYLTFQEYFEKPNKDGKRWGKPLAALLGAFKAQMDLSIGSIGGKDSMSGSFEKLDVPPTLVSFAVTTEKNENIISPEFKAAGHKLIRIAPEYDENKLPKADSLMAVFNKVTEILRSGKAYACYTPGFGGIAEAVLKMSMGNNIGFKFADSLSIEDIFAYDYAAFLIEVSQIPDGAKAIGETIDENKIILGDENIELSELYDLYENKLEKVYPVNAPKSENIKAAENISFVMNEKRAFPAIKTAKPRVLIPAFPGTNCEFDSAKAVMDAGAQPEIIVINNLTAKGIADSAQYFAKQLKTSQAVFIPGGFSGGDEPDGSGKFITAFFRSALVKEGVSDLLDNRAGLMCGICNGFQALIKLGLVPFGKIIDTDENCPTLTYNNISRHQSKIVDIRIASNKSPWLCDANVGDVYSVPISHGEGKFLCNESVFSKLVANGQIATQYVDKNGNATMDIQYNPNGSFCAVEGITSPDGRVFGKMGHTERYDNGLYKNVPGNFDMGMFRALVKYYK